MDIALSRNSNKQDVMSSEIHGIIFKILKEIDRICRKNHINYALSFGSALGIDNFKDFVPWDDDADVVIDYFDYHRLVEALKKDLGNEFIFDCFETNKKYNVLLPAIKVKYKNSKIIENNHFFIKNRGCKCKGLFIDICLIMGVPSKQKEHLRLIRKSKRLMPWICFMESILHINPRIMKNRLLKVEKQTAEKYKNSDTISQTVIIPFQQYPKKIVHNLSFPKSVIYPFKEYDFHGEKFYSFNDVHEFCTLRYGEFKKDDKYHTSHLKRVDIY